MGNIFTKRDGTLSDISLILYGVNVGVAVGIGCVMAFPIASTVNGTKIHWRPYELPTFADQVYKIGYTAGYTACQTRYDRT